MDAVVTVKLNAIKLDAQYAKAKIAYVECAAENSNLFLEELGAPVESINTKNESVRITFDGSDQNHYLLETKLNLCSADGEVIGWYCLHEDESGKVVDDFLVFG